MEFPKVAQVSVPHQFESFVRNDEAALLRFAFQLTRDRDKAADLVQEVLTSTWRIVSQSPSSIQNLPAYLRRSMINRYLNSKRSPFREEPVLDEEIELPDIPQDVVVDREEVRAALARLSPTQRTVLVLRYYLDLDDDEIAKTVGCQRSTVRTIVARALRSIRSQAIPEGRIS